jgi:hypothetical protein
MRKLRPIWYANRASKFKLHIIYTILGRCLDSLMAHYDNCVSYHRKSCEYSVIKFRLDSRKTIAPSILTKRSKFHIQKVPSHIWLPSLRITKTTSQAFPACFISLYMRSTGASVSVRANVGFNEKVVVSCVVFFYHKQNTHQCGRAGPPTGSLLWRHLPPRHKN